MKINEIILEGYKEVTEIDKLATEIIIKFAEMNYPIVNRIYKRGENTSMGFNFNFDMVYVEDCVKHIEMYEYLKDFILNKKRLTVIFKNDITSNGLFNGSRNIIEIKNTEDFKKNLRYQIKVAPKDPDDNSIKTDDAFRALKSSIGVAYRSILLHELQHAYDDFRSKGKYLSDKRSRKFYEKNKNISNKPFDMKIYLQYLKLPHEYWARFTQFAGAYFYINRPFKEILRDFKDSPIIRFNDIPEKDQKRLIKALYMFWTDTNEKES